jgi:hypothetical protein
MLPAGTETRASRTPVPVNIILAHLHLPHGCRFFRSSHPAGNVQASFGPLLFVGARIAGHDAQPQAKSVQARGKVPEGGTRVLDEIGDGDEAAIFKDE